MKNRIIIITVLILFLLPLGKVKAQQLLTLEQSITEALKNSPEMVRSRLNLVRTKELLKAQRASLKSKFSFNLTPFSYNKRRTYDAFQRSWYNTEQTSANGTFSVSQPIIWTDGTISLNNRLGWEDNYSSTYDSSNPNSKPPFKGFSNNLSLSLDQPLFTHNETKIQFKELEFDHENSQLSFALQSLNVEKQVTQYFYQIYQKQMELITSREELANRKKSLEIISNKVEAGLTAKEEMLQADLDMLTSQSTVQNNEVELENIKDNFKQMLGFPLTEEIMVMADVAVLPVDIDLSMATNFALANRMEIRQREIEIENNQFSMIRTNARNEFKGKLSVSVGLFGENEKLANVLDNPNGNQDVSFGLEIPIFDWGEKKARMRAEKANLEKSKYNLEDEMKTIRVDVRKIERNIRNALIQIEIARKNQENAQLTYEINLEKYRNGDLTSMDLNLFQNQLTQKKNSLTNALISYKLELLNMKTQTLYDFEGKRSIVDDAYKYMTID